MMFQNVMLLDEPVNDQNGRQKFDSVDLKVVDFGIFGSLSGIRMENINRGSLRLMAPELLVGHTNLAPKIDILVTWARA